MNKVVSHGPGSGARPTAPKSSVGTVNSHGPGSGARPTAPRMGGGGGFDPRAFAKMLNPQQRKDFQALGRNTKGDYMGWGKNAATGAGSKMTPEEMLRQRYGLNKGGSKSPPGMPPPPVKPAAQGSGGAPSAGGPAPSAPTASAGAGSGGGAPAGTGASPSAAPMAGLMQAMQQGSTPPPIMPETPPGLRQGLGMRQYPPMQSPLAGLQRIY